MKLLAFILCVMTLAARGQYVTDTYTATTNEVIDGLNQTKPVTPLGLMTFYNTLIFPGLGGTGGTNSLTATYNLTIPTAFASSNNVTDLAARQRLFNFHSRLNDYGILSGANGGLVDAVLLDKTYHGTNGFTYMGRPLLCTNTLYPDGANLHFPDNTYPWGSYFTNGACAVVQGLPNCGTDAVIVVVNRLTQPSVTLTDPNSLTHWVAGLVAPTDGSALWYGENPHYGHGFLATRSGTSQLQDGSGNVMLHYALYEQTVGNYPNPTWQEGWRELQQDNRAVTVGIIKTNQLDAFTDILRDKIDWWANGIFYKSVTNPPTAALTSLWIGADPYSYTNTGNDASAPYVGEVFAVLVFTNVPQNFRTNFSVAVNAAVDELEVNQRHLDFLGDSRYTINTGGSIDQPHMTTPYYWVAQADPSVTMVRDLQKGSTYPADWITCSNQIFPYPMKSHEIDWAYGYNTIKQGTGSNILAFSILETFRDVAKSQGAVVVPWTLMTIGTNNGDAAIGASNCIVAMQQYNQMIVSNAAQFPKIVREDLSISVSQANDSNYLDGGLHPDSTTTWPVQLSQYRASFYNAGTFPIAAGFAPLQTLTYAPTPGQVLNGANVTNVPLSALAASGATSSQVPTWNGSAWVPQTPSGGSGGDTNILDFVLNFGAVGDGVTDNTAAFTNACNAAILLGKAVFVPAPPVAYLITNTILLPTNSSFGAYSYTPAIRFYGEANSTATATPRSPLGGSRFNLTSANASGKILCFGNNRFTLEHITLEDTVDGTAPFIFSSGTTLRLNDVVFSGKTNANFRSLAPRQDAIVLGGHNNTFTGSSANDCFQGYGTVIDACYFTWINAAIRLQTYANGISFVNNDIESTCGGLAPIVLHGYGTTWDATGGNYFAGNIFELFQYEYAVSLNNASYNTFSGNSYWDLVATNFQAYYSFTNSPGNNFFEAGLTDPSYFANSGDSTKYQNGLQPSAIIGGTSGQVLTATANGVGSWSAPAAATSVYFSSGATLTDDGASGVYYNGNIFNFQTFSSLILGSAGQFNANGSLTLANSHVSIDTNGNVTASQFIGSAAGLTAIPAAQLTGTVPAVTLPTNSPVGWTNTGNQFVGTHSGNGSALTNLITSSSFSYYPSNSILPTNSLTMGPDKFLYGTVSSGMYEISFHIFYYQGPSVTTGEKVQLCFSPGITGYLGGVNYKDNNYAAQWFYPDTSSVSTTNTSAITVGGAIGSVGQIFEIYGHYIASFTNNETINLYTANVAASTNSYTTNFMYSSLNLRRLQ